MSLRETYDRQQAFAVGFALAARDWGLSDAEHAAMCKLAAQAAAPVPPLSEDAQREAQRQNFVKQRAAQVAKGGKPAPAPAVKQGADNGPPLYFENDPYAQPPAAKPAPTPAPAPAPAPAPTPAAPQKPVAPKAPAPPVDPKKTSPGSLAPKLREFLRNPSP
jgi:hypothetical protein